MGAARDRLLAAAAEYFYRDGINRTGIDTLIEVAGVAKMSLYNNFSSKDELVTAYLECRHEQWAKDIQARLDRIPDPRDRILAIFDDHIDHAMKPDFRGCGFINGAAELPSDHPGRSVVRRHKRHVAQLLEWLASEAGAEDPLGLAEHLHLILEGALASAGLNEDPTGLRDARRIAARLVSEATKPMR